MMRNTEQIAHRRRRSVRDSIFRRRSSALFHLAPALPSGTDRVIAPALQLLFDGATAIVGSDGLNHPREVPVGDKSPKSKERDQKKKNAAKAESAAQARSKQDSHNRASQIPRKAKN